MSLSTQTSKINLVISLKDKSYDKIKSAIMVDLHSWCDNNCKMYAFILHDRDILEDGTKKVNHIHLVATLTSSRKRLATTMREIADYICVDTLAISIEALKDFEGSIQYLIHKNNKDKFQYDIKDIVTNITQSELDIYMTSENNNISLETLVAVVKENRSMIDIMRSIGLSNYRLYRNVIWDIYSEVYL